MTGFEHVLMVAFWVIVAFIALPLWCVSRSHKSRGLKPPWEK